MKSLAKLIIAVLLLAIVGCNSSTDSSQKESKSTDSKKKLYVVTTTGMVTDAVENVGGEHVTVDGLMGAGVDPHLYKATRADTKKLAKADLIIYNGLHLEGKMGDVLTQIGRKKPVYAVTENVPPNLLREPPEFQGLFDPHIWFDVSLWKHAVKQVEEALAETDPDHKEVYQKNAKDYLQKLDTLHNWVHEQIKQIPKGNRVLITSHDAFGYFGSAYKVEVKALQGISTAASYGIKDRERIADLIIDKKIKAVFVETSVAQNSIQAVIQDCRKRGHKVVKGGLLFSDAMGEKGTEKGTYVGMIRHNVDTIVKALTGANQ